MNREGEPLFAPNLYGYGAGLPISWQGWALTIGYIFFAGVTAPFAMLIPYSLSHNWWIATRPFIGVMLIEIGGVYGHLRPENAGRLALAVGQRRITTNLSPMLMSRGFAFELCQTAPVARQNRASCGRTEMAARGQKRNRTARHPSERQIVPLYIYERRIGSLSALDSKGLRVFLNPDPALGCIFTHLACTIGLNRL